MCLQLSINTGTGKPRSGPPPATTPAPSRCPASLPRAAGSSSRAGPPAANELAISAADHSNSSSSSSSRGVPLPLAVLLRLPVQTGGVAAAGDQVAVREAQLRPHFRRTTLTGRGRLVQATGAGETRITTGTTPARRLWPAASLFRWGARRRQVAATSFRRRKTLRTCRSRNSSSKRNKCRGGEEIKDFSWSETNGG